MLVKKLYIDNGDNGLGLPEDDGGRTSENFSGSCKIFLFQSNGSLF